MANLTKYDEQEQDIVVLEEERLLNAQGFIDKSEMYKIMRHLAEKLSEYERAEEQGLLFRLPCKVGEVVYHPIKSRNIISTYEIKDITINKDGELFFGWTLHDGIYSHLIGFWVDCLGKTVFLTREEAEEALSELN